MFSLVVMMLFEMLSSRFESLFLFSFQIPANVQMWEQEVVVQVLSLMAETQTVFSAPVFGLDEPWLSQVFGN